MRYAFVVAVLLLAACDRLLRLDELRPSPAPGGGSDGVAGTGGGAVTGGTDAAGTGGQGGAAGPGGAGGMPACEVASDCAGPITTCRYPACIDGACGMQDAPVLTECNEGQGVCNGQGSCLECVDDTQCAGALPYCDAGSCVECLLDAQCGADRYCASKSCADKKSLAASCGGASECLSGACVDGFCCNSPCTGSCESCAAQKSGGLDGVCSAAPEGTDPDAECAAGVCYCGACESEGAILAAASFGNVPGADATSVAIDPLGDRIVTGNFQSNIDLGCGALNSVEGWDAYVAKIDATGKCVWSTQVGGAGDQRIYDAAVDSVGDIVLVGLVGGGGWLAKLSGTGVLKWSKGAGGGDPADGPDPIWWTGSRRRLWGLLRGVWGETDNLREN
jgi:hypothetical protein